MIQAETDVSLLLQALTFSATKHRDQRRKDREASPYINHPIQVVDILWRIGQVRNPAVLAAALLHDTLEDTETTAAEIAALFGPEVLALVQEVSDDKRLPKAVRKQLQIEHAVHASVNAKYIKLADKICNVHDLHHSPPVAWPLQRRREYLAWTARVVEGLRGTHQALEALYDTTLSAAQQRLQEEVC